MIDRKLKGEALIGKKCKPVRSLINHAGEGVTDKTICTIISVVRGHGFTIRTQKCAYCGQYCEMSHVSREQIELVSEAPAADVTQVVRCRDCVCMGKRPPLPEGYREDCDQYQETTFPGHTRWICPMAFGIECPSKSTTDAHTCKVCRDKPIPAEIAEKLGIKPKEEA